MFYIDEMSPLKNCLPTKKLSPCERVGDQEKNLAQRKYRYPISLKTIIFIQNRAFSASYSMENKLSIEK